MMIEALKSAAGLALIAGVLHVAGVLGYVLAIPATLATSLIGG